MSKCIGFQPFNHNRFKIGRRLEILTSIVETYNVYEILRNKSVYKSAYDFIEDSNSLFLHEWVALYSIGFELEVLENELDLPESVKHVGRIAYKFGQCGWGAGGWHGDGVEILPGKRDEEQDEGMVSAKYSINIGGFEKVKRKKFRYWEIKHKTKTKEVDILLPPSGIIVPRDDGKIWHPETGTPLETEDYRFRDLAAHKWMRVYGLTEKQAEKQLSRFDRPDEQGVYAVRSSSSEDGPLCIAFDKPNVSIPGISYYPCRRI